MAHPFTSGKGCRNPRVTTPLRIELPIWLSSVKPNLDVPPGPFGRRSNNTLSGIFALVFLSWDFLKWLYRNLRRYEVIALKAVIVTLGPRSSVLYTEQKKVYLEFDGRVMVAVGRRHPIFKYTTNLPCLDNHQTLDQ